MDEQWVEKHNVPLFHLKVYLLSSEFFILLDSEVGFVDFSLRWISVIVEAAFVRFGENVETPVFEIAIFQSGPGGDDSVGGAKGEVSEVLVKGVPGALAHVGRLVDEHGVHGFDVVAAEAPQVGQQGRIGTEGLQNLVKLEILNLGDVFLPHKVLIVLLVLPGQRNVSYDLHPRQPKFNIELRLKRFITVLSEACGPIFNVLVLQEVSYYDVTVVLVKSALLEGEAALAGGVLELLGAQLVS